MIWPSYTCFAPQRIIMQVTCCPLMLLAVMEIPLCVLWFLTMWNDTFFLEDWGRGGAQNHAGIDQRKRRRRSEEQHRTTHLSEPFGNFGFRDDRTASSAKSSDKPPRAHSFRTEGQATASFMQAYRTQFSTIRALRIASVLPAFSRRFVEREWRTPRSLPPFRPSVFFFSSRRRRCCFFRRGGGGGVRFTPHVEAMKCIRYLIQALEIERSKHSSSREEECREHNNNNTNNNGGTSASASSASATAAAARRHYLPAGERPVVFRFRSSPLSRWCINCSEANSPPRRFRRFSHWLHISKR